MCAKFIPTERSAAIIDWLQVQRWYGDKSRILETFWFECLGSIDCGEGLVELLTVDCTFSGGGKSSYFVPVESGDSRGTGVDSIVDAFLLSAFHDWLASGFPQQRILECGDRTMIWKPGQDDDSLAEVAGRSRLLRSEQSNTSILFGDQAIAKVFRRLQPGLNPDVEIIKHLAEETSYRHVPRHLGTLVIESKTATEGVTLAAVQGFVANEGDGWTWLLRGLEGRSGVASNDLLESIQLLGIRTAELHIALASPTNDQAFVPESLREQGTDELVQRLVGELDQTISSLRTSGLRSEDELRELRARVARKAAIMRQLVGFVKTRVHGDFHLGQVLRTAADFMIIDFEGEPSRSMAQRREKTSPLKDVAGMLRSLDYAVATRERAGDDSHAMGIREWGDQAKTSFLTGYIASIRSSGTGIVPEDADDFDTALDFFMIDKALYEIRYELDNRPDWIEIPLRALEAIANPA